MWNECLTLKDGDPCWMIQKTKISLQKKFQRRFQKKVLERLINEISNITVPIEPPQTGPILEFKGSIRHVQKGHTALITQVDLIPPNQ